MQITTQRKRNMANSEFKEFLKTIKIETEKGCWETSFYKNVNTKGQARVYYKKKKILLYQLSHLLFNKNIANPASTFHKCDNFICFNPTHLIDDLKEKQFKLEMPGRILFEGCPTKENKKKILIDYGNWLFKNLGRPLVHDDFEIEGRISFTTIKRYFDGSMVDYFNCCNFPSAQRKSNMTDSKFKEFLKAIKIETEQGCWVTDYWKTSKPDGRIQVNYKGKTQLLYRISYTLFKGSIPDKLVVTHSM